MTVDKRMRRVGSTIMRISTIMAIALFATGSISAAERADASITRYQINISRQPLDAALNDLAQQTGLQVARFSDAVRGDTVVGPLSGHYSAEQALSTLLEPIKLTFRSLNAGAVIVLRPEDADRVRSAATLSYGRSEGASTQVENPLDGADRLSVDAGSGQASISNERPKDKSGPSEATGIDGINAVDEVVVTATRRSESSLNVPLSIAALNGNRLFESHIKDITDLSNIVPGVTFNLGPATGPTSSDITIRGVGTGSGDSTTGIYLDEVAVQSTKQTGGGFGETFPNVFDLDRIEVLRGPQGTLFGSGAMGGAIRYIQKQPDLHQFTARTTGEVASTERGGLSYEGGLALGGPIVDGVLGFRVSAWRRKDGGYIDTVDPFTLATVDKDANRSTTDVLRAALTLAPVDGIKITPSFFWQSSHVNNTNYNYYQYLSDPSRSEFRYGGLERLPARDRFWTFSVTAEADLSFADLISITSQLQRSAYAATNVTPSFGAIAPIFGFPDGYGNPLGPGFPVSDANAAHLWFELARRSTTEELRLSSKDDVSALVSWTAGFYYSNLHVEGSQAFSAVPFDLFPAGLVTSTDTREEQISGFGQADIRIVDGLKGTLGVRIARLNVGGSSTYAGTELYDGSQSNTPVTPKVGLQYQFTPQSMAYFTVSKGFRAGGINAPLDPTCGDVVGAATYGPDKITSYEVGSKNRLFDDKMTFTISGYHSKWSDIQTAVEISQCNSSYLSNAATAQINGFEAETSGVINSHLHADLSVSYTNATYSDNLTRDGAPIVGEGYQIDTYSPWTLTGSLDYSFLIGTYKAFIRAEDAFHSKNSGPYLYQLPGSSGYNPDLPTDPSFNLLNLRAGIAFHGLDVALFATNTLNSHPMLALDNYHSGNNFFVARTLTPRTVGVNLNYNF
jgi:iron complex outermembrane recepter protein